MTWTFKKSNNIYVHIAIWGLYITCNILIQRLYYPGYDDYWGNIFDQLTLITVFYLNAHVVIARFAQKNRIHWLILLTVLLFAFYLGMLYAFQHYISPLIYGEPAYDSVFRLFVLAAVYNFIPNLGFSYGYSYLLRVIRNQERINELLLQQQKEREEKVQLAKERLFYENSFLQAQINPHFLFNALSFLYYRTQPFSEEISGGIMKLADVMRYALDNHPDAEGKVLLSKEINHIKNVIDINQLRFSNKLNIQFELKGKPGNFRIIPLLLITLVENAFKHGDVGDPAQSLLIELCIAEEEKKFFCRVKNKKSTVPVTEGYGIGLQNIRNRLEMSCKGKYDLNITEDEQYYTVELHLNL